ncbi:metallophosphoesterase family protein [Desulfoluna butyratoxydans]|uniref:Metallo-dependent phosphatase-like n=1 Tax=Desulfoluna butyratoxydans TaxID=231438 RepID=A0A4U8YIN1_9BACT|nr:metallophosphoesterase family protein [Desulfoluna butyratoxydans]VFQ43230.1 metallo-dependent phosphatase-like [Desulfoluna butyratoxydans]
MQILLLSDIHGHTEHLPKLKEAIDRADLVCLCGDLTSFQGPAAALRVVDAVKKPLDHIVAVSGNCDEKNVEESLIKKGVGIHGRVRQVDGVSLLGLGGSLITPFGTPNEYREEELASMLELAMEGASEAAPLVLISHQPPWESCADRLASGVHAGSHAVAAFIDTHRPVACLTGHIHESCGIENRNGTLIVNPGALAQGRYAMVSITKKGAEAELGTLS